MQKIAILTDSSCDLNKEQLKQENLFLLPLKIIYSNEEFNDKIDITPKDVFARLDTEIPTTSLVGTDYIHSILDEIYSKGYTHIIGIFISEALSGTFNAIRLAFEDRSEFTYSLFNSTIIGYPLGLIVNKACALASANVPYEEILKLLPYMRENISGYYTVETLEYLKRGGRISKLKGTLGELLNLKPIIGMDEEGHYCSIGKVRGRKQSINKIKNIILEELNKGKCNIWILNGMAEKEALDLLSSVKSHPNILNYGIEEIGAAMCVHSGPGMLGVAIERHMPNIENILSAEEPIICNM